MLSATFSAFNVDGGKVIIGGEFHYTEYQSYSVLAEDNQLYEVVA